jgi:autotransporter translocation and assembly factor TamB
MNNEPVSTQEFEAGLTATKTELEAKIDATKAELETKIDVTKAELETKIDATKAELEAKIEGAKGEILARMEKMETGMLTAFHGYTQSVSAHFKNLDVQGATLLERMAALEDRMVNLEIWRKAQ